MAKENLHFETAPPPAVPRRSPQKWPNFLSQKSTRVLIVEFFFFETCTSSIVGKSNRACMPASVASPFSRCPAPSPSPSKFPVQPPSGQLDRGHPARNRPDLGLNWGPKKKPETAKKIADVHRILERRFSTAHAHICHLSCPRLPRHPPDPPGAGPRFPGWWPKGPVVFFFLTLRALARQQPIPAACNCDRTVGYMVSDQFYLKTTPMGVLCLCLGLHVW